jgi:hypothetical protein
LRPPLKKVKRVVFGTGYLYEYVGSFGGVSMVGLEKIATDSPQDKSQEMILVNTTFANHKKVRLVAEIIESPKPIIRERKA